MTEDEMFELAMELDTDYNEATTIAVEVAKRAVAAERVKLAEQVRALRGRRQGDYGWISDPTGDDLEADEVLALIEGSATPAAPPPASPPSGR